MAKENDTTTTTKNEDEHDLTWGTLEELLLACAVNRHGTKRWDSVVMEIQSRSSNLPSLTPHNCKQKFHDLMRRFIDGFDGTDRCDESEMERLVPMVDELRRLRVAELRREVQRRDVSIVSLQSKVKKLEDEREQSLKENDREEEAAADLRKDREEEEERERERREVSPEKAAVKSISGEDSDYRGNGSYNESNSTNHKGEIRGSDEPKETAEPPEPGADEPDPTRTESKPVGDGSNNSNLDTVTKKRGGVLKVAKAAIPAGGIGESNELGESGAESKREGKEGTKQSSDVQSSASLSKGKRRRRRRGGGGGFGIGSCSSGEDPEGDEVSPATKRIAVKSQPLVRFLGIIRSHKLGSMFERRLRSQETEKYKNLIRQHMDLETVQSRLDKGVYSDCIQRFFRDLLLLSNNAVVFFRKNSPESLAAHELRALVLKEMANNMRKPTPITIKSEPEQQPGQTRVKPKTTNYHKTSSTPAMVACRKRSNVKRERTFEEKPKVDEKKSEVDDDDDDNDDDDENNNDDDDDEEKSVMKRRMKKKSVLGRRSTRTRSKNGETPKHECGSNVLSSHDDLEAKIENKDSTVKKKQGAARFLKRMKQNSPPNEVGTVEDVDVSEDESKDGKMEKKRRGKRRDGRKVRVVTRSTGGRDVGREVKEQNGQVKRGVGRPPKRQASACTLGTLPPGGGTGKRRREGGGVPEVVVVVATSGRPRKRSKR
ncbi:hypothetical protein L1049_018049 [Liquidambar formosana]|uniref:Bromo domain-containing protein n=1 Tax=Liquidambar formosana TaxID=63359 RepID=A0AAP0NH46_LIQFO